MGNKCDCYHTEQKIRYTYSQFTGQPIPYNTQIGVCWGTKECDECDCGGNRMKCDFYPEVRERARSEVTVQDAIDHFKYGISHDIFSEPVTTYAEMAVEALEKQIAKKPRELTYKLLLDDGWIYKCPTCGCACGINKRYPEITEDDVRCTQCGQLLDWK